MGSELFTGLGVAALLAIILVVTLTRPGRRRDTVHLYTEGLDHLLRGNLKDAYKCFKGVIERDTDNISAYLKMGQTLREAQALDKALQVHENLLARLELSGYDRLDLYMNLALDYSALGNGEKAVKWAKAILKLEKRNLWAMLHLVKSYRDLGDWAACGKYLGQWQKAKGVEDTRLLALCRFRQGYDIRRTSDIEDVREHYRQALKIDSSFAPAHYYLAESYAEEARARRAELSANGSGERKANADAAESWDQACADNYTQAVAHWTSFVEVSPQDTYRILPALEEALFYLQRFDDLELFLKQVLEKESQNRDVVASLANFFVRKGELDQAEEALSKLPQSSQPGALLQAIQLKLRYRRNRQDNLMPDLDRLVDSIQMSASGRTEPAPAAASLLGWLEPRGDPLETLA